MTHTRKTLRNAVAALVACLPLLAGATGLQVVDAWVEEGPPSVPVQAGYLTLENGSAQTVRITGVRSPLAERIEIHRSEITENTAMMTRITDLPLPPRSKLVFDPGGYHLMIYGKKEAPRAGEKIPLEVLTADGQNIRVEAVVRRDGGAGETAPDHTGHDHH